ncbi:MAG: hypothetical protein EOP52_13150 [Sphingobacteriales bacterium]|nr:MAG: hypothetical protein EOP52_13150 [Sphingobacteriales bacterium]
MRYATGVAIAILLAGCQSSGSTWVAINSQDQFTDSTTKIVTVGSLPSHGTLFTQSMHYYPFVGIQNDEIYVGLRSGGRYPLPTGTVQLRIDNNKSWTITTDETPIYLMPASPAIPQGIAVPGMDMSKFQTQMMQTVAKAASPYTATTGAKAKSILKEMTTGKKVIYRTVGINQAASTTGEVAIDSSFIESLRKIGIDPNKL